VKLINNRQGQIRTIEAFLASLLIFATLALIPSPNVVEKTHYSTLATTGTQALLALDSNGALSQMITNQNWTALRSCTLSLLPVSLWFNITVFDENMAPLNNVAVSNGGPINEEIVAVNYVCASPEANYKLYIVRLQLAEAN